MELKIVTAGGQYAYFATKQQTADKAFQEFTEQCDYFGLNIDNLDIIKVILRNEGGRDIDQIDFSKNATEKSKDCIEPAGQAMGITDISGLYVARNDLENFNILVCAQDEEEAMDLAVTYFFEGNFEHHARRDITISEFDDINTHFDCDYIIA